MLNNSILVFNEMFSRLPGQIRVTLRLPHQNTEELEIRSAKIIRVTRTDHEWTSQRDRKGVPLGNVPLAGGRATRPILWSRTVRSDAD